MKAIARILVIAFALVAVRPMLAMADDTPIENQKNISSTQEDNEDVVVKNGNDRVRINVGNFRHPEEVFVPIAFFIFLAALFLGRRHLIEKTNQRKIELLEKMVEKGQPVSDAVIQQVFSDDRSRRFGGHSSARTVRRGVAFTAVGLGLLIHSFMMQHTGGRLIAAIVLLGLGIGFLVSHRFEKKEASSSEK